MPNILIYTTSACPYCTAAKRLLNDKRAAFEEISVEGDSAARAKMAQLAGGRRTVPQIFIDGCSIGGCDELYQLEREGRLDALLRANGAST
jgi:glutaredoxin 3